MDVFSQRSYHAIASESIFEDRDWQNRRSGSDWDGRCFTPSQVVPDEAAAAQGLVTLSRVTYTQERPAAVYPISARHVKIRYCEHIMCNKFPGAGRAENAIFHIPFPNAMWAQGSGAGAAGGCVSFRMVGLCSSGPRVRACM